MADGFGFGGSGGFGFGGGGSGRSRSSKRKQDKGGNFVSKFIGNLASDVKDSVVGIPGGVKMLATDPGTAVKAMATSTWATWSPLFRGDFQKFGHAVYDHPLAPLLDVATVFTLGAGGAARGAGALSKAGVGGSKVKAVAGLRQPKRIVLKDPTGVRHDVSKNLSTRAGRRIGQEALLALEPHLPKWVSGPVERGRFEARFAADMAHRVAAKNLMATTVLQAGKALTDPETAPRARQELAAGLYLNLHRHAPVELDEAAAREFLKRNRHYRYVVAADKIDRNTARELRQLEQHQRRLQRRLERTQGIGKLTVAEELASINKNIREIQQRSYADFFRHVGESDAAFESFVDNFGRFAVTRNVRNAARTQDGKVRLVPRHDAFNLGTEAKNSSAFVKWAYREPTRWWKMALLGWTPRIVTNNAVGNWAIYAAREGGDAASIQALGDAVRLVHGEDVAARTLRHAVPFKRNNWLFRYFGDELGNTFRRELDDVVAPSKRRRLGEGFYPIVHKVADEPVRVASIGAYLRRSPEVKALMARGMTFDGAVNRALRKNPGLREEAVTHARATAGDYVTIRNWEEPLRALMPFYLWNRHIVRTMGATLADTPGRVAIGQRLSQAGVEETERILGELPEFLRGAIPLGGDGKRADVLLTHSLNPFATIGELAGMTEAALTGGGPRPGAALLGQTHPFITGGYEWASGTSLLTGAPKPRRGGVVTSVLGNTAESLPQVRLVEALLQEDTTKTPGGGEALYAKDDRSPITSLLGVPLRDVSLARAAEMAAQEGKPRRRRRKRRKKQNPFS